MSFPQTPQQSNQEYLDKLQSDYLSSQNKFDSQTLYIASGALAISLTFIKDIIGTNEVIYSCIYIFSLLVLVMSIITGLYGHYKSSLIVYAFIQKRKVDPKAEIDSKDVSTIKCINLSVFLLIGAGVSSLVAFCIINILFK